jgi:hypothetical protein
MRDLWQFFTSLRLTIYLLIVSTILVFFGTLDQVHDGIFLTQQRYFEHFFVVWKYPAQWILSDSLGWIHLPLPGGYLVGPLLVINLLCAHFRYYRAGWRKVGIGILHLGVIALLVGQLITQIAQEDYSMWLSEGARSNYLEAFYEEEFVVIDKSPEGHDRVYAWPLSALRGEAPAITHPDLPFRVQVIAYYPNAAIFSLARNPTAPNLMITRGIAADQGFTAVPQAPTYAMNTRNLRTAAVEVFAGGENLGRWMLTNGFGQTPTPNARNLFPPQTFTYQDRTYEIAIRPKRAYLPAHIELVKFSHDRYPGTEIPVNFSSDVRIIEANAADPRSTLIYMNHPLRYAGYTFYQASFGNNDTMSMFQVVRNPGRWVPYIACLIITIGMTWQFVWSLARFLTKNRSPSAS